MRSVYQSVYAEHMCPQKVRNLSITRIDKKWRKNFLYK